MKNTVCMALALLLVFAGMVAAQDKPKTDDMTLAKVIEMSKAGLGDETIINTIISSNATFNLSVQDVLNLKKEGVSENVINFMLRTRPLETAPATTSRPEVEPAEPENPNEPLPAYVADAGSQNYYDGYEYTDGYNYENDYDRYSTIIYHYYGPWFRSYPYYFGFCYYPSSYYYYTFWPDDYYYYYYYPRFSLWRSYYYYPHWRDHYFSGGGRYIKSPGGRVISRYGDDAGTRYAVPREGARSRIIAGNSTTSRGKISTSPSRYYSPGARSRNDNTRTYSSPRIAVPRSSAPSVRPSSPSSERNRGTSPSPRISKPRSNDRPSGNSSSRSSSSSGRSSGTARSRH